MAISNGKIWWRVDTGNWNGSATADPASGTGGISVPSGAQYFMASVGNWGISLVSATVNTMAPFVHAPPSGFLAWGGVDPTGLDDSVLAFTPTVPSMPTTGNMWFDGINVFFQIGQVIYTFTLTPVPFNPADLFVRGEHGR